MNNKKSSLYTFEGFCLDAGEKCLRYADEVVSLTPKAYDTLLVLIRHSGKMVEKDTLMSEIWPDTFVEESTLAQNILTLRKTFARFNKDMRFIATVPSRGYRFIANVEEFFSDEETLVVEKHTQTRIIEERLKIHESGDSEKSEAAIVPFQKGSVGVSPQLKIVGALVGLAVLVIGFLTISNKTGGRFVEASFKQFQVNSLVSDANIRSAVLSPNGKYLATVVQRDETQALTLRQVENSNTIDLISEVPGTFIGAAFSPDGEQIYYSVYETNETGNPSIGSLYKIPLLGGASQKILSNIDSAPAISADMRRIAFIRRDSPDKNSALVVFDIYGVAERTIATRDHEAGFTRAAPDWSPDGKLLSCTIHHRDANGKSVRAAVFASESGEQKFLSNTRWEWAGKTLWLRDGSGIITVAFGAKSPNLNDEIWLISYPDGNARSITSGINGILGISADDDSSSIAAIRSHKVSSFFTSSLENLTSSNMLLTKTGDDSILPLGAHWTSSGQIVFSSTENGNADIWVVKDDGTLPKPLTSDKSAEFTPSLSLDSQTMLFLSNRSGIMSVWRSHADGTGPVQVTDNQAVTDAVISPAGDGAFYIAPAPEALTPVLWKVSIDGKYKTQMTKSLTYSPRVSRDGKHVACYMGDGTTGRMNLTVLAAETGEIVKLLKSPFSETPPLFDWGGDGKTLLVIAKQGNSASLWAVSTMGDATKKIHEWQGNSIFRFSLSKDGKSVFFEKGVETNSILLLSDTSNTTDP